MAMTKAEKARVETLQQARDMARALRWPEGDCPQPLTAEEVRDVGTFKGWRAWTYQMRFRVEPITSSVSSHYNGHGARVDFGSQGHGNPYRTRLEALRACRFALTIEAAKALAGCDTEIAREIAPPTEPA